MARVAGAIATFVLAAALSGAAHGGPCAGFADVDDTSSFCPNVEWLKNRGVTLGCAPGLYCPVDPVSRLQMAAFLNRLADALFPLTCATGQVMKWDGTQWACAADNTGGTVTSVAAGTGLQGSPNPITGAGSLNLAPTYQLPQGCGASEVAKWSGSAWSCAADAGTVTSLSQGAGIVLTPNPLTGTGTVAADTAYLQRRVSATCAAGSSIRAIAADGTVTCETDDSGPANAFVQGGNAFGALAVLGTNDNRSLELRVNGARALRIVPDASPSLVGGYAGNLEQFGAIGQTIAGGGGPGADCYEPSTATMTRSCANFTKFGSFATVGGGRGNVAEANAATVAGGESNYAFSGGAVGGGFGNRAGGGNATVAGGTQNDASGGTATIGGGWLNSATNQLSAVGGGSQNVASGFSGFVGGGGENTATETYTTVAGGFSNEATQESATVAGGYGNAAQGARSAVGGGYNNVASGGYAVVAGGGTNQANGILATVGGGASNQANGSYSTVPGGFGNQASGNFSVAMGRGAIVNSHGSFVFADGTFGTFISGVANEFIAGFSGGVGFYTEKGFGTYCRMGAGAGSWSCSSSRHQKRDFTEVSPRDILERVAALPVTSWRFRGEPASVRHVGPTAQDFRAAFSLGDDDESIAQVDANGVALAAIQGLYRVVQDQRAEIAALLKRVADLESASMPTAGRSKISSDTTSEMTMPVVSGK